MGQAPGFSCIKSQCLLEAVCQGSGGVRFQYLILVVVRTLMIQIHKSQMQVSPSGICMVVAVPGPLPDLIVIWTPA